MTIGDDTVSPSNHIRNLEVHMDQHLSMTYHVTAVCAACNYHLYRLSSIRHYLTTEAARSAVNALVTSRLDDCNSLLHNMPLSQTARLQRVPNNAARLITRTSKHDHITPVLKELHWLPVKDTQSTHSRKNRLLLAIISHFIKRGCIKYSLMIA